MNKTLTAVTLSTAMTTAATATANDDTIPVIVPKPYTADDCIIHTVRSISARAAHTIASTKNEADDPNVQISFKNTYSAEFMRGVVATCEFGTHTESQWMRLTTDPITVQIDNNTFTFEHP